VAVKPTLARPAAARGSLAAFVVVGALCGLAVVVMRRPPASDAAAGADVAAARLRLAELQRELDRQQAALANGTRRAGAALAAVHVVDTQAGGATAPRAAAKVEAPAREHEPTGRDIISGIDARFYRQPAQAPWGRTAAARVHAVLGRLLGPGTTLGNVDCRETLCRIAATHHDLEAYQRFTGAVLDSPRDTPGDDDGHDQDRLWNAGLNSQVTDESPTSVTSVTFLSREGAPVPGSEELAELAAGAGEATKGDRDDR
jgi:hypothetical protein